MWFLWFCGVFCSFGTRTDGENVAVVVFGGEGGLFHGGVDVM